MVRLLKGILLAAPDFVPELLSKHILFTATFGKAELFQEQKLHDQKSQLLRLLEQFLAQLNYQSEEALQARQLLSAFEKRNLADHFPRLYRKIHRQHLKTSKRDNRFFLDAYLLEQVQDAFQGKRQTRKLGGNLNALGENLDVFYLGAKLRSTCEMLNRSRLLNQPFRSEMMKEIQSFLQQPDNRYLVYPSINIYFQIYLTLTSEEGGGEAYRELVQLLKAHAGLFPSNEAYAMYAYAQNFCIRQINQGKSEYLEELFRIYQRLLKEDLLLKNGVLAHEHYKNINTLALKQEEFEWAFDFLQMYRNRLPAEYKENAFNYNLAVWHYEQHQPKSALKLLQQVDFTDVYYHLSAKFILLKIYYEQQDDDALDYLIKAFLIFLKRNKQIAGYQIQAYQKLIRLIKKTARLRKQEHKLSASDFVLRWQALHTEVQQTQGIANSRWLKKQLQALQPPNAEVVGG
ncbi:MAG: hypothetical protein AAF399_24435 [Bacteroidota bacterium]